MADIPKVLKNFNVFIDGRGYAGKIDEITLPEFNIVVEEHRAGGMDAPVPLDMGMEMMEMSFVSAEHNPFIYKLFGLMNQAAVSLVFRAASVDDQEVWPYILKTTGMFTSVSAGTVTNGEKSPLEVTMQCRKASLDLNGEKLFNIDVPNMIREIGGQDQLRLQRAALAL